MNDVKSVRDRLEAALARIETSATRLRQAGREVAALTEENRRLARALADAEADRAELLRKAERISGRLDGAIDRLESVLEH